MKYLVVFLLSVALSSAAEFSTGQAARLLIGQTQFTVQDPGASQTLVGAVGGLAYANGMLFVTDANRVGAQPINHRVLVYKNLPPIVHDPRLEPDQGARCPICIGAADVVLGQPDFEKTDWALSQKGMRLPTAVATDGNVIAVADTDNNRILIWRSIPSVNAASPDVVLGQPDFTSNKTSVPPNSKSLRGPQGVWIQNGKLFVADTQNHRVLIWNSIPTTNGKEADVVLGQPDFSTFVEVDLTKTVIEAKATTLLNPVSVTSDGIRLYVTDLGHNRVLIWNSIPTSNQKAADVVVGQPDMTSAIANNSTADSKLCEASKNEDGEDEYPRRCGATLDYPRYALSDGNRLFISDGGNDRVLVFNSVPTANGAKADVVLGQPNEFTNQNSDNANPEGRASSDSVLTPMSLAWDGTNLYVSDPYNRRVMLFTPGDVVVPYAGWRNAASLAVYAVGALVFDGTIQENDEVTVTIQDKEYKYKIGKEDTFTKVLNKFLELINEGEGNPWVLATLNPIRNSIIFTSKIPGPLGNFIEYDVTTSPDTAKILISKDGVTLQGGQDAARIGVGSLITLKAEGVSLSDVTTAASLDGEHLPFELGGVQVYIDGILVPLLYVSPDQINAQLPWQAEDTTSVNAYVRTKRLDGRITISNAIGIPVVRQNPGIFTFGGDDPRPGVVLHYSSYATGTILVDGSTKENDVLKIKIGETEYSYTVKGEDTKAHVRDAFIQLINDDPDSPVIAFPGGVWERIRLRAKIAGPEGNGIPISVNSENAQTILTATKTELCCANVGGSLVTEANPAIPGETIVVYGTGLGIVKPDDAKWSVMTGYVYRGPEMNDPIEFVSSLAGGKTANVLFAGLRPGTHLYEIHLELNPDLPTNPKTTLTIAQDIYVSNIITFPVYNPQDDEEEEEEEP